MIKGVRGATIVDNKIWLRQSSYKIGRSGISVTDQAGSSPEAVTIARNYIYSDTRTVGINVESAYDVDIIGNRLVLDTPGDSDESAAINVRATTAQINSVEVQGNRIVAEQGKWHAGVTFSTNSRNIRQCAVGGGNIADCTHPLLFTTGGGGAFGTPPIVTPIAVEDGVTPLVPTSAAKWFQLAGVGGAAAESAFKPGVFWGDGSPEGVLSAPVGSMALRRDGTSGTVSYVKNGGTGNTGWAPVGGVAAIGKITCVAKSLLADTDFMTIGDGLGAPKLYEFDVTGGGVTAGRVAVDVSTATTAAQVAVRLTTAIETNQPSLAVTHNGSGVLSIVHKIAGVIGNVTMTENVAAAGFVVAGLSGGVDPAR